MRALTADEIDAVNAALYAYLPQNDPELGHLVDLAALKRVEDLFAWDDLEVLVNDEEAA